VSPLVVVCVAAAAPPSRLRPPKKDATPRRATLDAPKTPLAFSPTLLLHQHTQRCVNSSRHSARNNPPSLSSRSLGPADRAARFLTRATRKRSSSSARLNGKQLTHPPWAPPARAWPEEVEAACSAAAPRPTRWSAAQKPRRRIAPPPSRRRAGSHHRRPRRRRRQLRLPLQPALLRLLQHPCSSSAAPLCSTQNCPPPRLRRSPPWCASDA
jgi:hypothetical protein